MEEDLLKCLQKLDADGWYACKSVRELCGAFQLVRADAFVFGCVDRAMRSYFPSNLKVVGLPDHAQSMERLDPIVDSASSRAAYSVFDEAARAVEVARVCAAVDEATNLGGYGLYAATCAVRCVRTAVYNADAIANCARQHVVYSADTIALSAREVAYFAACAVYSLPDPKSRDNHRYERERDLQIQQLHELWPQIQQAIGTPAG